MFKRIFVGYMAVLLISFTVLALAFNFTVRQYLINDTIESLHRVSEILSSTAFEPGTQGEGMRGAFFKLANRIAYADYVVLRSDGIIVDSSDPKAYPHGLKNINESFMKLAFNNGLQKSLVQQDLVAVSYPVVTSGEGRSGRSAALILYTQLDLLTQLNQSITGILALAVGAGSIVSLIAGLLIVRVVVGPLQQFKNRTAELARRRFSGRLEINTGDELEELAEAINDMSGRLEEYDQSQKEFFRNASHELKTPLMSVQGYAEALKDGVIPDSEKGESLDLIIRESERMKALVEEFIYLSKMETLKENYSFKPLNPGEAVREAIDAVQSLALEKNIEIAVNNIYEDTIINGDPEKIHRLLLNLLGNALRYAASEVTVNLKDGAIIEIIDDGPGFKAGEEEEEIFKPFYKGENGGSGLGLTISRAIAENHRGTISAKNNPEGGAKITVHLGSEQCCLPG